MACSVATVRVANAEQQLRELIKRDYSHPSITMWSVGNEPDRAAPVLSRLDEVVREKSPTRLSNGSDAGISQHAENPAPADPFGDECDCPARVGHWPQAARGARGLHGSPPNLRR
ncbi:Glycosyl hydrolases family 2, TIM barrel domain [Saccharopolyspora shandongensis]|uniref:Glycosyl hydrolases family 2, TIM barrel domain n=1 Tax=Saccharopolyspora shandongensis TaxID=418495 RepID=A0A1H3NCC3_9PSEU|nr:Glycosyl hydrolases family 2, TIM barrel domain [Saccharopolyspora shandongensis]